MKNKTNQSPRIDSQENLYWYQGDTFSWQLNFTLTTCNQELTFSDIQDDTITFSFYRSDTELFSRSIPISNLSSLSIEDGTITGFFSFFIVEEETSPFDLLTSNFPIGNYLYNARYIHNNSIITIIYNRQIKVE